MNHTALRYFVAVVKAGSIREGAESLRIAQSAISRQIMGLEAELDVKLLERQPRGIGLTAAGEMFLRYARDGLSQMTRMRSELNDLKRIRAGVVRLAAIEPFAHRLLPQCVTAFLSLHPGVGTDILVSDDTGVAEAVRTGEAALGISFNAEENDLRALVSLPDPLVAMMRRSHPLAGAKRTSLTELAGFALTLPSQSTSSRHALDQAAAAAGLTLRPLLESDSTQLRLNITAEADTIAVVSRIVATQWRDNNDLVAVPIRDKSLSQVCVAVFSSKLRQLPPAAEAFAQILQQQLRAALAS